MTNISIKSKENCRWDFASLGEVLLRFCPGDTRISDARNFQVYDGGAEYNVARNLSTVFNRKTAIVTVFTKNEIGSLLENLVRAGGVDTELIKWSESSSDRNGSYFIERGFGVRPPCSSFDRNFTGISKSVSSTFKWDQLFREKGIRWFNTGGVFAGLSESTPEVAIEAMKAARTNQTIVSYDLNYRDSLWRDRGGIEAANSVNRELASYADVLIGLAGFKPDFATFDKQQFAEMAENHLEANPNTKVIAITIREVITASKHNFKAACYADGKTFISREYLDLDVYDRVGSGDAFASGFFEGIISNRNFQESIEIGAAAAAMAMTTPGDSLICSQDDLIALANYENAEVRR